MPSSGDMQKHAALQATAMLLGLSSITADTVNNRFKKGGIQSNGTDKEGLA